MNAHHHALLGQEAGPLEVPVLSPAAQAKGLHLRTAAAAQPGCQAKDDQGVEQESAQWLIDLGRLTALGFQRPCQQRLGRMEGKDILHPVCRPLRGCPQPDQQQ